ncbi:RDD family protein [Gemella sp. GH3]|uniref:RDD family protein n=1 Tax=unclassified Gemella TaxID=2624949 RepID=UPI0015D047E2|nr:MULTISPECIES: RDD family protein [unclassified Gemella]MBF0713362.1 RDD family protein [Gemella sp. GH3.1]NYS50314.1 RDD family protein [Gemella sp. GH3]
MTKKLKKSNSYSYGNNVIKKDIINKSIEKEKIFVEAKISKRVWATVIDAITFYPFAYVMILAINIFRTKGIAEGNVELLRNANYLMGSVVCLALVLFGFLPDKFGGQTIGKKIFKIQVVDKNGSNPGILKSFLRDFVFKFLFAMVTLPLSIIISIVASRRESKLVMSCIYDKTLKTRVVEK